MKTKKKKKKKKGHNLLEMTITTHHQPYLLIYKLATLLPEEYCDCSIRVFRSDCSIRVYRSFKQVFRGPFMGPPGAPFRLGPGAKCPSCPPLWAAPSMIVLYIGIIKVWAFLTKNIILKPASQYFLGTLAVLVRYNTLKRLQYELKHFQKVAMKCKKNIWWNFLLPDCIRQV